MSALVATRMSLNALSKAMDVLNKPYNELPELRDGNNNAILDARDKRLKLIEDHIKKAGDIVFMLEGALMMGEMAVQEQLAATMKDEFAAAVKQLSGKDVQMLPEEEPPLRDPRKFGFGIISEEMEKAKCR